MIHNLRKLADYLIGRSHEVQNLDLKDLLMAKVILDIHQQIEEDRAPVESCSAAQRPLLSCFALIS